MKLHSDYGKEVRVDGHCGGDMKPELTDQQIANLLQAAGVPPESKPPVRCDSPKRGPADMCYIGRKPCGCVVAAVVDDGKYPKRTAENVAEMICNGYTIERIECSHLELTRCKCASPPND